MYKMIGNQKEFAVEVALSTDKWNHQTALWINNNRLGDWEDKNLLGPFIISMRRVAMLYEELWLDEIDKLDCYNMYLTINPYYNNPDDFYDLPDEEQEALIRFDKFLFFWGENFDSWNIRIVYRNQVCKFLWVHLPRGDNDSSEVRNNVQCFDVPLKCVQEVYNEFRKFVPSEFWGNSTQNF